MGCLLLLLEACDLNLDAHISKRFIKGVHMKLFIYFFLLVTGFRPLVFLYDCVLVLCCLLGLWGLSVHCKFLCIQKRSIQNLIT